MILSWDECFLNRSLHAKSDGCDSVRHRIFYRWSRIQAANKTQAVDVTFFDKYTYHRFSIYPETKSQVNAKWQLANDYVQNYQWPSQSY